MDDFSYYKLEKKTIDLLVISSIDQFLCNRTSCIHGYNHYK